MFKEIIFQGKVPGFEIFKKIILFSSFLFFLVIFFPELFNEFWSIGRKILLIIVFVRPLADILPKLKILKKIVWMRKELWIACGSFILAHGIWFFLANNYDLPSSFFQANFWNFSNFFGWWMAGFVVMIPLLLTSNTYSMRLLWKHWKTLQRLTYLFFIFWAIHVAMIEKEIWPYILIWIFIILQILAFKKIKLWT